MMKKTNAYTQIISGDESGISTETMGRPIDDSILVSAKPTPDHNRAEDWSV